jgi:hypothetical protein
MVYSGEDGRELGQSDLTSVIEQRLTFLMGLSISSDSTLTRLATAAFRRGVLIFGFCSTSSSLCPPELGVSSSYRSGDAQSPITKRY